MAYSLNKVMLIGNVGQDPRIVNGNNGKFANIRLATSESWMDKNTKEKKTKTEWHSVVIYNENLATIVENYVKKGTKLYIEGSLVTRKWVDKENNEKYTTEIVLQNFNGALIILSGKDTDLSVSKEENYSEYNENNFSNKKHSAKTNDDEYNDFLNEDFEDSSDRIPF